MNPSATTWPLDHNAGGIYIHVPFCKSRCHYCAFVTNPYDPVLEERYTNSVTREMDLWSHGAAPGMIQGKFLVDSIYFGGGTPSLLRSDRIAKIIDTCHAKFRVIVWPEITIEVNPASSNRRALKNLRSVGVNRVSLGMQSLNDEELRRMGRPHNSREAVSTFKDIRSAGFDNISVDLMAGFPGQSMNSFSHGLEQVLNLGPDHLSVYLFELKEGTRTESLIRDGKEPACDDDLAADQYEHICRVTKSAGYEHYEVSNFCLRGRRCSHNLKYWEDQIYFGFGPGAHGMTGRHRYSNMDAFNDYQQALLTNKLPFGVLTELTPLTRFKDALIMGSRLVGGLDLAVLGERYSVDAFAFVSETVGDLREAGLFVFEEDMMVLTPRGRLLSNQIFSRWV